MLLLWVRVNLTPWGGTYCSDTGALKKQWAWLDNRHHVHAPPYRALRLPLSPNLHIHVHSQEDIRVAFTRGKRSVRLNVGSKLKVSYCGINNHNGRNTKEEMSRGQFWPTSLILRHFTFPCGHSRIKTEIQRRRGRKCSRNICRRRARRSVSCSRTSGPYSPTEGLSVHRGSKTS